MPIFGMPTNQELFDNAPDTVEEAIKGWLARHVAVPSRVGAEAFSSQHNWLDWAARNLRYDPEVLGAMKKEFGIE